ncbi:MAG: hypothetical protein Q7T40_01550 [Methylobacter sp.]|nr:hypothetical protein [Methylobacter sp.]
MAMELKDLMMLLQTEEQEKIKADGRAKNEVLQRFRPLDNDHYSKQYLGFYPLYSDEWMYCDVWDTETAVKLITIGYPLDLNTDWRDAKKPAFLITSAELQALAELRLLYNNKEPSPFDPRTLKRFSDVYSRATRLAESSIARGKLKAIDTPSNWLAWAKGENYSTHHLDPIKIIWSMEFAQSDIDFKNCNEAYREQFLRLQEIIGAWKKIANIWGLAAPAQAEPLADAGAVCDVEPERFTPRTGGYRERDIVAIVLVEESPVLLEMRPGGIKKALQDANNIFLAGYADWWRNNPIFPKGTAGTNPK